ncbi:hypothetical protein N7488_006856 [Penicillium malachiteum]|nr:hypothetical protein N7488_006856 [Penicillium malachiteum]
MDSEEYNNEPDYRRWDMDGHYFADSPSKPPFPYVPGWRFTVQSQVPPPPTPVIRGNLDYTQDDLKDLARLNPADHCVQHPPLPGEMGTNTLDLEIVDLVRAKFLKIRNYSLSK